LLSFTSASVINKSMAKPTVIEDHSAHTFSVLTASGGCTHLVLATSSAPAADRLFFTDALRHP
jgi:hypothetical protein